MLKFVEVVEVYLCLWSEAREVLRSNYSPKTCITFNPDTIDNFHLVNCISIASKSLACLPTLMIHHFIVRSHTVSRAPETRVIDETYNKSYYYKIMMSSWWGAREKMLQSTIKSRCLQTSSSTTSFSSLFTCNIRRWIQEVMIVD